MKKLALFLCIVGIIMPMVCLAQNYGNEPYKPADMWSVVSTEKSREVNFSRLLSEYKLIELNKNTPQKDLTETGLNGAALGYLLKNQELIPVEWRNKVIVFTGTKYNDGDGNILYLNLYYFENEWVWGRTYINEILEKNYAIVKK